MPCAPLGDSAGSSSARRGATRPSSPCAGSRRVARIELLARAARGSPARSTARSPRGCDVYQSVVHSQTLPGHVEQTVAVRRELADRRRPLVAVVERFCTGTRPATCSPSACPWGMNSSPQTYSAPSEPAARGELPLGLGRKLLAGPLRIGLRIARTRRARRDGARARGASCPGPRDGASRRPATYPPVEVVAQVDGAGRLPEHHGAGKSSSGWAPGYSPRVGHVLGEVTCPVALTNRRNWDS